MIHKELGMDADRDELQKRAEYRERILQAMLYLVNGFVFASDSNSDKSARMGAVQSAAAEVLVIGACDAQLSPLERQFKASQIVEAAERVMRGET